jgi:hypothetical protein
LSAQASVVAHCLAVAASSTSSRPQTQQRTSVSVAHVCPDVMVVQIFARLFVQLNHGLPRVCEQWQEMLMITALNHLHLLCMVALLFHCIKKVITILGQVTESCLYIAAKGKRTFSTRHGCSDVVLYCAAHYCI